MIQGNPFLRNNITIAHGKIQSFIPPSRKTRANFLFRVWGAVAPSAPSLEPNPMNTRGCSIIFESTSTSLSPEIRPIIMRQPTYKWAEILPWKCFIFMRDWLEFNSFTPQFVPSVGQWIILLLIVMWTSNVISHMSSNGWAPKVDSAVDCFMIHNPFKRPNFAPSHVFKWGETKMMSMGHHVIIWLWCPHNLLLLRVIYVCVKLPIENCIEGGREGGKGYAVVSRGFEAFEIGVPFRDLDISLYFLLMWK